MLCYQSEGVLSTARSAMLSLECRNICPVAHAAHTPHAQHISSLVFQEQLAPLLEQPQKSSCAWQLPNSNATHCSQGRTVEPKQDMLKSAAAHKAWEDALLIAVKLEVCSSHGV